VNPERGPLEKEVRSHCDAGRRDEAVALIVRGYGAELFSFLVTAYRGDEAEASESFSQLIEALWRGLPAFAWDSSARTWAYAIAHKLTLSRRRDAARQRRRVADVGPSSLERIAERVRTETASFLRTEKRTRLQALRDSLSEEDRLLLLLRVDRELSWNDVARILAEGAGLHEPALAREAARHRKRYQLVKDRLREMARQEGLLE
jgi:RNA polymerase sigma-70 factor (ECF subfamily)